MEEILRISFLFILFTSVCSAEEIHSHEDLSRGLILDEIIEHVGAEKFLKYDHLQTIFYGLNFKNCSDDAEEENCNKCLSLDTYLKWKKYDLHGNFTKIQIKIIFNDVIYFLTQHNANESVVCKIFKDKTMTSIFNSTALILKQYGRQDGMLNEESLKEILTDLKATFRNNLTSNQCFSADDILEDLNITSEEINKQDLEYVNAYIIYKLLNKNCISLEEEHHRDEELPKKNFFVKEILTAYGNVTHLTHEEFESLVENLKLGGEHDEGEHDEHDEENEGENHDEHNHKRRRRNVFSRSRRSNHDDNHGNLDGNNNKCYSAEQLLTVFGVPEDATITEAKFEQICPALIQQLNSKACEHKSVENKNTKSKSKSWKPWIGAMIATAIISLGSLGGVFAAPLSKKPYFNYILMFLICLAISTLIGDAVLHLLPHSLNLHKHEEGAHNHASGNEFLKKDSFLWKCVLVIAGIYFFFNFEIFMHAFTGKHGHTHNGDQLEILDESHKHVGPTDTVNVESVKGALQMNEDIHNPYSVEYNHNSQIVQGLSGMHECAGTPVKGYQNVPSKENHNDVQIYILNSDHNSISSSCDDSEKQFTKKKQEETAHQASNFKSVVWMVLIGDAIHNFMDGVAIGVAFTEEWPSGLHGGISTSIAILCHELPHELGDFAILISSGMSIKQALLMNFISSLTSFGGAILGVVLGTEWDAVQWLFAITSGLFIYIALVDMLPEMIHNSLLKVRPCFCFVLQNIGLLTGFVLMFLMAAWEEDIKTMLS